MSIKEKLKAEIERLKGIGGIVPLDNREQKTGYESALIDIEIFLDTLEEKSEIPTNLDEAVEKASIEKYPNEIDLNGDHDAETWYKQHVKYWRMGFKKGFKAGAMWDREQGEMIERDILALDIEGKAVLSTIKLNGHYDFGDKVIIQIRKKDE